MTLHLLTFNQLPILEQLQLEERLLRLDDRNFCLINKGSNRSIVMGISGKAELLIDLPEARKKNVPLIKRFSGGGTVIVDENTLFVTFIFSSKTHDFPAYPERIHALFTKLYQEVFLDLPFAFKENDYLLENRKCGGNAQYIKRNRWLHHTSFLWDFEKANMQLLLHPPKTPSYRAGRDHCEFLCKLKDFFDKKETLEQRLIETLQKRYRLQKLNPSFSFQEETRLTTTLI